LTSLSMAKWRFSLRRRGCLAYHHGRRLRSDRTLGVNLANQLMAIAGKAVLPGMKQWLFIRQGR
jgi:hypothetical protein